MNIYKVYYKIKSTNVDAPNNLMILYADNEKDALRRIRNHHNEIDINIVRINNITTFPILYKKKNVTIPL